VNYIEWLRVRNCLRTTAIVLVVLVALAAVLRISLSRYMSPQQWVAHIANEPGAAQTHITLPDGTKRTIIDNPADREHVIIDDRGKAGTHIVVTEPASRTHKDTANVQIGSIHVDETRRGDMATTTIDTNGAVPMLYFMAFADIVALIIATMLAAPFAREIDGHLEIALTKPVSRIRYALGVLGADVAGIVAACVLAVVACYVCELFFGTYRVDFSGINARAILMGLAMPAAWYALLCAATTWFSRAYGAVLGFAWPVAIVVGILAVVHVSSPLGLMVHDVGWVLSRLDPLTYVKLASHDENGAMSYSDSDFAMRFGIEVLLFVVYAALALVRWERVEA
jgi:hypothetical protein